MTVIEILAVIFVALVLLKMAVFAIKPKILIKLTDVTCKKPVIGIVVSLILAVVVGYYIFSYFSIVEVASIMIFTSILIKLNFLTCPSIMLKLKDEIPEDRLAVLRKFWLSILIWVGLAVWVLFAVFS